MALCLSFPATTHSGSCESSTGEDTECWAWCLSVALHQCLPQGSADFYRLNNVLPYRCEFFKVSVITVLEDLTVPDSPAMSWPVPE